MVDTAEILTQAWKLIERDGWQPDRWRITGPWGIRAAISAACVEGPPPHSGAAYKETYAAYRKALLAISGALKTGSLGQVTYWEQEPKRTVDDIRHLFAKAIAIAGEKA